MNNPADRLAELKIDRSEQPATGGSKSWLLVVAALVVLAAAAWYWLAGANAAVAVETDTARRPPSVAAASSVLDASGYVTARRQATVSSEQTGKVVDVLIEEGMSVTEGQVVARLDDTRQRAQLALANAQLVAAQAVLRETEAQLRAARLERDRLRELAARGLTSTASVDAAEANFDTLDARLGTGRENVEVAARNVALAQEALDDMTIRAPFAGVVVSKNAQPGEMISPVSAGGGFTRTGICTIVDMDSLEIEVDVNEAYIQRVKAGQRVSATLDAYPDWQIPAEVLAIVPTADRQKATVRVRIGFLERDDRVLRDMGAKVAFLGADAPPVENEEIEGVLIAGAAVRQDEAGDYVWRIANDTVERRRITLAGNADRDRVLVTRGLAVGDRIVLAAEEPLSAGRKVTTN